MRRVICVSISKVYPQVLPAYQAAQPEGIPHILEHATAYAWKVNPRSAVGVEYVFGIANGDVRSVYRVAAPPEDWPRMPPACPPSTRGRRIIPVEAVDPSLWAVATTWTGVEMVGGVRYGELVVDPLGTCESARVSAQSAGER
jgi:hypothetical protein